MHTSKPKNDISISYTDRISLSNSGKYRESHAITVCSILEKPLAFVYVQYCVLPSEIYSTSVLLRWTEFEQTWHESNTQHFEPRLCFSDQLVSKDGALAFDWLRHFFTFPLQPLNIIWWNLIDLGPFFLVNMHIIIYVLVGWLVGWLIVLSLAPLEDSGC